MRQATRGHDYQRAVRRRALTRGVLYGVAIAVVAWGFMVLLAVVG